MTPHRTHAALCLVLLAATAATPARGGLDLSRTVVERLDNGLTVLVLEERSLPVVSVQMLYRVGARNEVVGRTGLAHFLEHMAFRATENFPDTDVVSRIYAAGGEWHGYTWIDQTTYYETLSPEHLDLALDIEADRMARLELPRDDVEAERGAVLAELHGYENDPGTVLVDAVVATSFQQHPYRYNTIGWESDVESLTYDDVVAFYEDHYRASNGVLAVVGAVDPAEVLQRVRHRFEPLPGGAASPLPRTVEPTQRGLRRVELVRDGASEQFLVVWRAPSATDPDWPAFLLLREILGGTNGVSFHQEGFGVAVRDGSRLAGAAGSVSTWSIPSALPYVFGILGRPAEAQTRREVELALESVIREIRGRGVSATELDSARDRLLEELIFDLQTTEDAAHQLAYYEGIGALDVLLDLPDRLRAVTRDDVHRAAREWLRPDARTIGWVGAPQAVASPRSTDGGLENDPRDPSPVGGVAPEAEGRRWDLPRSTDPSPTGDRRPGTGDRSKKTGEPVAFELSSGLPVVFQRSTLSPTGYLRIVMPAVEVESPTGGDVTTDSPLWRHASVEVRFLATEWEAAVHEAYEAWRETEAVIPANTTPESPAARLGHELRRRLGIERPDPGTTAPVLIAVAGDLEAADVRERLEYAFGEVGPGTLPPSPSPTVEPGEPLEPLPGLVQAQLGFTVPAPPPTSGEWAAWRMLLYILTHDYEGRLGKEAISRRGLLYWIGNDYHCDGRNAWIAIEMGVDPPKLEALRNLFQETLAGLEDTPPTQAEIDEARGHLLGRHLTAAQSNPEITARLAEETVCFGQPLTYDDLARRLEATSREDVARMVDEFLQGALVVVR